MIEMLEKSWKVWLKCWKKVGKAWLMLATNLTISPFPHHTISPSHNLCNFREIVDNGVGAGFHETLSQTVAVRNADGHTVGVATHENVEVGVAYDDGVLGLQVVVLQRFQHRLGVGLSILTMTRTMT